MINKNDILREWDLTQVPTPAYVIHQEMLRSNFAVIDRVRHEAEVEIIVALKANATWHLFSQFANHSDGATASSLSESLLFL